ncbi:iron-containing alcohol dehydrogenase [Prolixibacter sp. SD074]|jgi:NADP-dependent alcohol dehydrogenase|uniref:iron-containing alcohol dehydrogenase n=1 Tax=Prolixibacter sp. SD074 TaxID=2652391 RepID=UPI0012883E97|nr:iron-containing alcohol dehydrogenase [Prolixibacter sp. SD074]GET29553.1 alcohol dehydrogenase [Prolixibacter sp. SD074]
MNNFEFYNPVRIVFGKGEIAKLKSLIPRDVKVMLTYGGGSIMKNGVYGQVKEALQGVDVIEFGGIEPNPHYETLMKAIDLVQKEKIGFLLSVGGGSVLDGTKFIAAGALWPGEDPWEILTGKTEFPLLKALPLGAVLTLPATGSEMNGNSVVTRIETREKLAFGSPLVMPEFSILDPTVVFSLPDRQVANGVVDAFVHVMEQYLTYPVDAPIQDRFAESILTTLIEEGPKVLANRNDYNAAANFMWAATMALNGLIGVGVPQDWSAHTIGHEITAFHGVDHARTLAVVLPGLMHIKRSNKKDKILQYGARVWNITEGTEDERTDQIIAATVKFFESVGIQTRLSDYDIDESFITKVKNRFLQRGMMGIGEHGDISPDQVAEILEHQL